MVFDPQSNFVLPAVIGKLTEVSALMTFIRVCSWTASFSWVLRSMTRWQRHYRSVAVPGARTPTRTCLYINSPGGSITAGRGHL